MALELASGVIPLKKEGDQWFVLLVCLRSGGHWGFPKGHYNSGESPLDCAKRELREETNLELEHLLFVDPILETYTIDRGGVVTKKTVSYFIATVCGDLKIDKRELLDGKWVEIENAKNVITYGASQELLNVVIRKIFYAR